MNFGDRVKENIVNRAAEALAVSLSVIVIWVCSKIGPTILPLVESSLSKSLILTLFLGSLALNFIFLAIFWVTRKKNDFILKYGVYWDKEKNPHCPKCKIPIGAYSKYITGWGYFCNSCDKTIPLSDQMGKNIKPEEILEKF